MKAAIMGYGTIGSGVAEVLRVNRDLIAGRVGEPIDVKYILDLREFPGDPEEGKFIKDINTFYGPYQAGADAETKAPLVAYSPDDIEPADAARGANERR